LADVSEFFTAFIIIAMMKAVSTFETSANLLGTTRRNIPEDAHLYTRRRNDLKSHQSTCV
jgi:hypothetical protein